MKEYLAEAIGTFFLLLAIILTGNPIAIGAMLMVMVYMAGHISGAHFNPAVTLAAWLRGAVKGKDVPAYISFQILGATAAAAVAFVIQKTAFLPAPGDGVSTGVAFLTEILFTFTLALVILTVATTKKLEGNYIYGLAIGTTLMAIAFAGGPISGGVFNPAVAVGPVLFNIVQGNISLGMLPLYIVAPLVGGAVAAGVHRVLNPKG